MLVADLLAFATRWKPKRTSMIIDPALQGIGGHHYSAAERLAAETGAVGGGYRILCSSRADSNVISTLKAERCFSESIYGRTDAGMLEFERNPRIGSLTVHFDRKIVAIEKLESTVDLLVDRILQQPAQPGKSRRRQINRYAKIGMLGSLTASLALLAAGQKRGHAIAGALFVASLSVHLGLHRKHLLR